MKVRTRFAPSPTGFMHVGGVRTALFAWLVAKQKGGQFCLRIEDTDRSRHVEAAEQHITDSLSWLGLNWDEGPLHQSDRLNIYREWAEKLIAKGRAYADSRSPEELEQLRGQATATKRPFLARENRPDNPPAWTPGLPLRFKAEPKNYSWPDEVMGQLKSGPEAVDDFILIKSDGFPTYNFAHIVDDHLMEISHVIRSQEFLSSVPRFLNLYEALEIERPLLATLPYVLGEDGRKKLSKRDGAKDLLDYKREGYLPEAIINFLATLGWNDGTEQEIFTREQLLEKFSLSQVQRSGAKFDERRLVWMNGHWIRSLDKEDLAKRAEPFWPEAAAHAEPDYRAKVLDLVTERLKFLGELPNLSSFFFSEPEESTVKQLLDKPPDKQLQKIDQAEVRRLLKATEVELSQSDFSQADLIKRLNDLLSRLETKPGILFAALRIAVTGAAASPDIAGTLAVLGKYRSLDRLQKAIGQLGT